MCDYNAYDDDIDAQVSRDPALTSPFTVVAAITVDVDQHDPEDDPADEIVLLDIDSWLEQAFEDQVTGDNYDYV